ncbi:MAG: anhydro-N-acetylmuramic acid kinase, partial [Alphaproteobacteria bacterium]
MAKLRIIGNMTGNSMDAVDVVLTEFDGEKITDICSLSIPYSVAEKQRIDALRQRVVTQKIPAAELIKDNDFLAV